MLEIVKYGSLMNIGAKENPKGRNKLMFEDEILRKEKPEDIVELSFTFSKKCALLDSCTQFSIFIERTHKSMRNKLHPYIHEILLFLITFLWI